MKSFQKKAENFTCAMCGCSVHGTGYTNHCPRCLWSKHVDINPGDRANPCKGLMKPVSAIFEKGEYTIIHKCTVCKSFSKCKASPEDNPDLILSLSSIPTPKT